MRNMIKLEAQPDEIYDIELEHSLLEANEKLARQNRALLDQHGTTAIDFMGAIGSGKTTLITKLVEKLQNQCGVAVFNGDATTSEDADQIEKLGVQIVLINKIDLAEAMGVSVEALITDVHTLKPDIKVIPTSCKDGTDLDLVAQTLLAI